MWAEGVVPASAVACHGMTRSFRCEYSISLVSCFFSDLYLSVLMTMDQHSRLQIDILGYLAITKHNPHRVHAPSMPTRKLFPPLLSSLQ